MDGIYPHPECMAPDGADPCEGYHAALKRVSELEQELQALREATRWIPITEKLPDEGVPVLVCGQPWPDQIRTALIAWEEWEGKQCWHWEAMTSCFALNDPSAYEFDDDYEYTHWMPLPRAALKQGEE